MHSQHSGARRADEAAHRDVGVSHPGLVALEAVFVYSGLGQLPDLAGADLLVVPVLSVRHLFAGGRRLPHGLPGNTARSPPFTTRSTSRPHYGIAFLRLHPNVSLHTPQWRQAHLHISGSAAGLLQNKSNQQGTLWISCHIFTLWKPVSLKICSDITTGYLIKAVCRSRYFPASLWVTVNQLYYSLTPSIEKPRKNMKMYKSLVIRFRVSFRV